MAYRRCIFTLLRLALTTAKADVDQEVRKTSKFMQYAIYAASEALRDAQWQPETDEEREETVCEPLHIASPLDLMNLYREYAWALVSEA